MILEYYSYTKAGFREVWKDYYLFEKPYFYILANQKVPALSWVSWKKCRIEYLR